MAASRRLRSRNVCGESGWIGEFSLLIPPRVYRCCSIFETETNLLLQIQLPSEVVASLEDAGVKYIP